MRSTHLQETDRFVVSQKTTLLTNEYVVRSADADGTTGEVVAFARQTPLALAEEVTLYTDETRRWVLCTFEADQAADVGEVYTVRDEDGRPIGSFHEKILTSLLRSTWVLDQPEQARLTGRERNAALALLRRVWDFLPGTDLVPFAWPRHFDFAAGEERWMAVERTFGLRDRYRVRITGAHLDRRLAIAQAVALDALA
ncbi:hypothetical protein [Streptomyces sp. NPDC101181]|uniref:hypothetical protein n=1 Tax=Streptomyces sp. NPDC101181 TaxID=3366125 RepID=UPI00381D7D98